MSDSAAKRQELAEKKIRAVFWQPLRIADHDAANAALDLLVAELDRAVTDIAVTILALRACDEAGEAVPARLRAHIRVMEDEWFNLPTPEGAARRGKLSDAGA